MYTSEEVKSAETKTAGAAPKYITITDGVAIVAGMVIGPGIFKTPALVAANSANEFITLSLWCLGGLISLIGALCYAELTSTYPHAGGEYNYLFRSYGKRLAFLFAWARMTVIQTGSIAMLSFIIGDYASEAFYMGPYSTPIYAAIIVLVLTGINLRGIRFSSSIQKLLMFGILFGLLFIAATGFMAESSSDPAKENSIDPASGIGQAMIFILLTYGGWNEAAYISADMGRRKKDIVKVLFYSIGLITSVYIITNISLMKGLGFQNVSVSEAVAADLVNNSLGKEWVKVISAIISIAALSTVNAVMITGARTSFALGGDFKRFRFLGRTTDSVPVNAFLFQSGISLVLILLGTLTRSGFITMVEYTAPVFWFFFLLVGISVFILRWKDPGAYRPFSVPLFPVTPILFCVAAAYMLHASLVYTGMGAMAGVAVLMAGVPFVVGKGED